MTMRRRLPMVVEESVGRVDVLRHDLSEKFDRNLRAELPKARATISCIPGCAWCCHHPVSISILEGILLYRWLLRHGKWTTKLKVKLKVSADHQFGASYEVWLLSLIPCPLLDEKKRCLAYDARPLICRAYYSISDPYLCHPHHLGSDTQIIPRDTIVDPFHKQQEEILRKHKLQLMTVPVGTALLMAEKIESGEADLDTFDSTVLQEYGEKG
jgi:Fe-S-cluster containining protein